MADTHTDIIVFWWHCILTGWGFGYGIFDAFVTVCLLASAGFSVGLFFLKLLLRNFKPKKWKWESWEERLMKAAFLIFLFAFIIVTVLVGPFREYRVIEKKANDSNINLNKYSLSNSFLNGVIEGEKTTISTLQKEIEDNRRDAETAKLNFKTDVNEANRQKDATLERLSFFEANPEKLLNIYSNIFVHTPTNLPQFDFVFQQFTNALNSLNAEKPNLVLKINGVLQPTVDNTPGIIVQGKLFPMKKTDNIVLSVQNLSKPAAPNINIELFSNIDSTNITAPGWTENLPADGGRNHWITTCERSTGQFSAFQANPITISSNFPNSTLQAIILFHADNSISYESAITFVFQ